MQNEIVLGGMGGQGVMIIGQLLAHAALLEDMNVVWFPSYGPETRGGTAKCTIIISDKEIGSPLAPTPDVLVALTQLMLDKESANVKPGGTIIYNSSLANPPQRPDCKVIALKANDLAAELGNIKTANMVMLGAFIELVDSVKMESIKASLKEVLPERYHKSIPMNEAALDLGADEIKK